MNPSISARELMIRGHAGSLGVSEDALRKQVDQFVRRRAKGEEENAKPSAKVDETRKILETQHDNALLLVSLALANPDVLEWLRDQDIEELHHDFPGTDMLHRIWLAHFPKVVPIRATTGSRLPSRCFSPLFRLMKRLPLRSFFPSAATRAACRKPRRCCGHCESNG